MEGQELSHPEGWVGCKEQRMWSVHSVRAPGRHVLGRRLSFPMQGGQLRAPPAGVVQVSHLLIFGIKVPALAALKESWRQ